MSTIQPEALALSDELDAEADRITRYTNRPGDLLREQAAAELRRLHAENVALSARVQELGQMARDVNSRRVVELEAQLASIGAGGVGPLVGQPQAMTDLTAMTERGAVAWAGVDAQELREGFTAADMATAAAQGFRDGVASLSLPAAGQEPVAIQPTPDVAAKMQSNTWDHFGDILPTLKAISRGDWYWGANSRCKYIEIRLDTRDGGCILYDRERVRISPEQFAHQAGGGCGKMEPWPATNAIPPSSAQREMSQ